MSRRTQLLVLAAFTVLVAVGARKLAAPHEDADRRKLVASAATPATPPAKAPADPAESDPSGECSVRPLKLPDGLPAMVGCTDARRIVSQVRGRLALAARSPEPGAFAEATIGWLDPHGLWSAAPDAPAAAVIEALSRQLISELERSSRDAGPCSAALEIGRVARDWVGLLRGEFEAARARTATKDVGFAQAFQLASQAVYEDDPVTRPARVLARDLGARTGAFQRAVAGDAARASCERAAERLLPQFDLERWSGVALAAAVRAYVSGVDPHGQWVPLDEEWSLYAADAAVDPGPRLWGHMARTAIGLKVLGEPAGTLRVGDLVLSVGGIVTAGLSVEQAEQLARLEPVGAETSRPVVVLRRGARQPLLLDVDIPEPFDRAPAGDVLEAESIDYGEGSVLIVRIEDVPDALGEELSATISTAKAKSPGLLGVLLDLRGNGGGSTDGAAGAIGVFLPGKPSFPLLRRGGTVEVQRAFAPPPSGQWTGPVATLVDGYTASAAEMIAGALAAYGRAVIVGSPTFGKGCIQEYFDDRAGAGVLRLTTMLFSLPDGAPLQGVGLQPSLRLTLATPPEREATLAASLPPWRGPDVRSASSPGPPWPPHRGRLGTCRERPVCTALARLGSAGLETPRAAAAPGIAPRRAGGARPTR